jgi:hypothetical protein
MSERAPEVTSIKQPERTSEHVGHQSGGQEHCQRTGGQQPQQPKSGKEG